MDQEIDRLLASLGGDTTQQPTPAPTRSGRIPQRPHPNHSSLLDYLIFPEDSESDDPDFDPTKNNPIPPSTTDQHHFLGFDFSTLESNHPTDTATENQSNNYPSLPPKNPIPSTSKLSPLTDGVPFININFPESDDSPEFIPPLAPSPPCSAKKRTRPRPPPHNPVASSSTSECTKPCPTTREIDPSLQPYPSSSTRNREEPKKIIKLPPSISSRYVAIAPNPNYPVQNNTSSHSKRHHDRRTEHEMSEDDDGESEASSINRGRRVNTSILPRLKPGPKPKPLVRSSSDLQPPSLLPDHHDDAIKRKREGMRQTRERKKLYIVSLEDRCLELAEENAKLKEENQSLLKESRENWKSKARSLEIINKLTIEIERLKYQQLHHENVSSTSHHHLLLDKNKKMNKIFPTRGGEEDDSLVDQHNNNGRNKRRKLDDGDDGGPSLVPSRPCGRTLLDLVALKP